MLGAQRAVLSLASVLLARLLFVLFFLHSHQKEASIFWVKGRQAEVYFMEVSALAWLAYSALQAGWSQVA